MFQPTQLDTLRVTQIWFRINTVQQTKPNQALQFEKSLHSQFPEAKIVNDGTFHDDLLSCPFLFDVNLDYSNPAKIDQVCGQIHDIWDAI